MRPRVGRPDNVNSASGHSHVGQQIGKNYGPTTVHNQNTYNVNEGDPPETKYRVAINQLSGGSARLAERTLENLLWTDFGSTEVAYYYALAIFADRSRSELTDAVFQSFRSACHAVGSARDDEWRSAFQTIWHIVDLASRLDADKDVDEGTIAAVFNELHTLAKNRQAEITRHLEHLLSSLDQDKIAATAQEEIAVSRMGKDRSQRAWKFFEPDPEAPKPWIAPRTPLRQYTWPKAIFGCLATLYGLYLLDRPENGQHPLFAIGATLVFLCGTALVLRHGFDRLRLRKLLAYKDNQCRTAEPVEPVSPGHWVTTEFVVEVHNAVDQEFRSVRHHVTGQWESDTRAIRSTLKTRFIQLYGNSRIAPAAIAWLIRWHAERTAAAWQANTFFEYRTTLAPSVKTLILMIVGWAVIAFGVIGAVFAGAFVSAAMLAVGAFLAANGIVDILASRWVDRQNAAENDAVLAEEEKAYLAWKVVLANRPSDAEMAEWLDLDKTHLRNRALQRCGVRSQDLIDYVVLTQPADNAKRARLPFGTTRYSKYTVLVFLLTRSGVREVEVQLDFEHGDISDERRQSFRYDALASAEVSEVGVQAPGPVGTYRVNSRTFQLTLVNGQEIGVEVESADELVKGPTGTVEDTDRLLRIALDASGVSGALLVLEVVAAEGREWIVREQQRRRRRMQNWMDENRDLSEATLVASTEPGGR